MIVQRKSTNFCPKTVKAKVSNKAKLKIFIVWKSLKKNHSFSSTICPSYILTKTWRFTLQYVLILNYRKKQFLKDMSNTVSVTPLPSCLPKNCIGSDEIYWNLFIFFATIFLFYTWRYKKARMFSKVSTFSSITKLWLFR